MQRGKHDRIDPGRLNRALDDDRGRNAVERTVAVDSGNFMGYPSAYLRVPDEAGFCFTQGFQAIGLGLATAIGAALARPDRLPVAACGDGGFLMGISELETAVRLKSTFIPVSVLTPGGDVIKDSIIGAFPRVILAEGDYRAIARNDDRTYERTFKVITGVDGEVEVLAR